MPHKRVRRFFRRRRATQPARARAARARVGRIVRKFRASTPSAIAKRSDVEIQTGTLGIGGGAGGISIIGKGITGVKTIISRTLGNPLAGSATVGAGLKAFGKRVGGRALGLGLAVETFQFGRAKATGKPFDPIPDLGLVASAAINPLATFGGLFFGAGEKGVTVATQTIKEVIERQPTIDFQPFNFPGFEQGDVNITFPEGGTAFAPSTPQPPVGAFFPSIDLQVGAPGGGQNELIRLLILLLGAGGLGALLGRKTAKKKNKKSKKDDDGE